MKKAEKFSTLVVSFFVVYRTDAVRPSVRTYVRTTVPYRTGTGPTDRRPSVVRPSVVVRSTRRRST